MTDIKTRVARGMEQLDNQYPGWRSIVDPADVDQAQVGSDVRALVTGQPQLMIYDDAVMASEVNLGFYPDEKNGETFEELNDAWSAALN